MKGIQKPHVVAVPFSALGHSIPFLDLAKQLALQGAVVSFVTTTANACRLEGALGEAQSVGLDIRAVVLPTPAVEGLQEGRESADVNLSVDVIFNLAQKLAEPFEHWLHQQLQQEQEKETGLSRPVCIISDLFMLWTLQTGEKYGVPRVLFNTCGAFATTLLDSVSASISHNALQKEGDTVVLSVNLPSPLRFNKNEIAAGFFEHDKSNPRRQFVIRCFQSLSNGSGMLINTFEDLEAEHLRHLISLTGKPIWSIGPVLPPCIARKTSRGKNADICEDELVRWLDSQRPHSVVYVSFGSSTLLSERQTVSLAKCLEASEQPFVWAIKLSPPKLEPTTAGTTVVDAGIQAYLPHGFEDRMKSKGLGLIIWGWAPQLLILSHPSVGAFMTHCGWNSTLESITLGVPMITWPMYGGDQLFNSKQVAEHFGIGVQFCQHIDGVPEEERVKEVLRLVLTEDEGKEMRKRAEPRVTRDVQFAVNEECGMESLNRCAAYRSFLSPRSRNPFTTGKPVFHIEYVQHKPIKQQQTTGLENPQTATAWEISNVAFRNMSSDALRKRLCLDRDRSMGPKLSTVIKAMTLDGWVMHCDGRAVVTRTKQNQRQLEQEARQKEGFGFGRTASLDDPNYLAILAEPNAPIDWEAEAELEASLDRELADHVEPTGPKKGAAKDKRPSQKWLESNPGASIPESGKFDT